MRLNDRSDLEISLIVVHVEIVTISIETQWMILKNKLNSNHAGTVVHKVYYLLLWIFSS